MSILYPQRELMVRFGLQMATEQENGMMLQESLEPLPALLRTILLYQEH